MCVRTSVLWAGSASGSAKGMGVWGGSLAKNNIGLCVLCVFVCVRVCVCMQACMVVCSCVCSRMGTGTNGPPVMVARGGSLANLQDHTGLFVVYVMCVCA